MYNHKFEMGYKRIIVIFIAQRIDIVKKILCVEPTVGAAVVATIKW